MLRIELTKNSFGGHDFNHAPDGFPIPEGWAVVPDTIEVPDTFPFVDIDVEGQTVTAMTAGVMPEPEPAPEPEPTLDERVATLEESNAEMTEALDMILSGVTE